MASSPQPVPEKGPAPWYATVVGAVFVLLVLAGAGLATAASYDNTEGHAGDKTGEEHGDGEDHGEDEDHSDE